MLHFGCIIAETPHLVIKLQEVTSRPGHAGLCSLCSMMTSWIASIHVGRWTSVYPLTSSASFLSFRVSSTWESSCLSGRNKIPGEDWLLDWRIPSAFGLKTPSSWLNASSNSQWVNYLYDFTLKWVTVWMYKIEMQATEHVEYLKVETSIYSFSFSNHSLSVP